MQLSQIGHDRNWNTAHTAGDGYGDQDGDGDAESESRRTKSRRIELEMKTLRQSCNQKFCDQLEEAVAQSLKIKKIYICTCTCVYVLYYIHTQFYIASIGCSGVICERNIFEIV